jgi:hypothetical protein
MAADKDVKFREVTLLRQHPNPTCPARVRTSVLKQNHTTSAVGDCVKVNGNHCVGFYAVAPMT